MACVYRHIDDRGTTFYVGISGNTKRPYDYTSRNRGWKFHASKYGVYTEILTNGISRDEAKEIEVALISFFGRRDLKTGLLMNMTDGGDGVVGHSLESIEKIRKVHIGRVQSKEERLKRAKIMTGKKRSDLAKSNISKGRKGIIFTEEHKKNLSISHIGQVPGNARSVVDLQTGINYTSLKKACDAIGLKYKTEGIRMNRNPNSKKNRLKYL